METKIKELLKLNKRTLLKLIPENEKLVLPKYMSPMLNFFNSIKGSQTGPNFVGQLSELFNDYLTTLEQHEIPSAQGWKKWYLDCENVFIYSKKNIQPKSGHDAFKTVVSNNQHVIDMIKKDVLSEINIEIIEKWIDDLLFAKTFQGLFLEKPIAIFVTKQWCKDNGKKFNQKKLIKSNRFEESSGIDYIYREKDMNFNLQIKTSESGIYNYYRKKNNSIPTINEDIYFCEYTKIKENIKLKVFHNSKILYEW